MGLVTRVFGGVHVAVTLALAVLATPAAAVNVTVGATTYDISFAGFSRSFLDEQAAIEATPWWGNQTLATKVANAYLMQVGVDGSPFTDNPNPFTQLWFAYETGDVGGFDIVRFARLNELDPLVDPTGSVSSDPAFDFAFSEDRLSNATFAILGTSVAAPVPEINAGSLAQALFVLLALHLWVRARRGRHRRA